ncbi:SUMF1/EgtB/PvdO family nonheme iron enzyme, partial [Gemmatimonadota bacterium]
MARVRLNVLGPPELLDPRGRVIEEVRGVPLVLLAFLLLQKRPVSRDHLAGLFWPGPDPARSRHSLRQALFRLRSGLPKGTITGAEGLSASHQAIESDIQELFGHIREQQVEAALSLWRGPFLSGFRRSESWELQEWIDQERARTESLLRSAVVTFANAWIEDGQAVQSLELLGQARRALPNAIDIAALEVRALADLGRVHEAEAALATLDLESHEHLFLELADDIERSRRQVGVPAPPPLAALTNTNADHGKQRRIRNSVLGWTAAGICCVIAAGAAMRFYSESEPAGEGVTAPVLGIGFGPEQFGLIPAGTFLMGDSSIWHHRMPVHAVTLTNPFYMQKTEVTQAQWEEVMGSNPSGFSNCGPHCPVEQVSWHDVQVFIDAL